MGRAGGFLLLLLVQDLGPAHVDEDRRFSVRPPAEWAARGAVPGAVSFAPRGKPAALTFFKVSHYPSPNPTPLRSFVAQGKEYLQKEFKGAQFTEEKDLTVAGRPAFRMVFTHGEFLQIKTVVHRTNREYLLLDAQMAAAEAPKYRAPVERAMASLELLPLKLTEEERAALGRFLDALKTAAAPAELAGEEWHAIYLGKARIGRQRAKVSLAGGRVAFELDLAADFGEGNKDASVVRGSFSPDGRSQKVDVERTKESPKERWQFRASGTIEGGKARVSRDLNGFKEEASFDVEEGVAFEDVADVLQKALLGAGKGTYLIRTLSPYEDEPGLRLVEVSDREPMEIEGRRQAAQVVFTRVDRRKTETYYYGADRRMIRQGGLKESFCLRAVSKEEAEKP